MPQLELATYASQIFWLLICFALLYIYLAKSPLPTIREVLYNRQTRLANDLKKAETLKEEAKAAEQDFTSVITEARKKSIQIIHSAKASIAEEETARLAKVEHSFIAQSRESEQRMAGLRKDSLNDIIAISSQAAVLITEKLINVKIAPAKAENLSKNYIKAQENV